jgi:type I restriction enzyme R subunit
VSESQFSFLKLEFTDIFDMASWAERHALSDPGPALIHARKCLESGIKWIYRYDASLPLPYEETLNAYLNEPAFKAMAGERVFSVAKKIQRAGNRAVHESKQPTKLEAVEIISALYQFCFWLAFTYGRSSKPDPAVKFDPRKLTDAGQAQATSLAERQQLEERLEREAEQSAIAQQRAAELTKTVEELDADRRALIAEVAAAKRAAEAIPIEAHDWSEDETRRFKIDALLAEAGWKLTEVQDREYEVHGMPSGSGVGYVDYVLWGDDGLPLGLVEAKKTMVSPLVGQQQARLYADCLEAAFNQRPVIFYSNGYEHWLWDDTRYPPRQVQGFFSQDELALMIQRRTTRHPLASLEIDGTIVERFYHQRAIRAIAEHFETERQRKALLVMATGTGKTRTVIALADLLMRANWVKRVLFLADRTALVNQAVNVFKALLPNSAPVNLVTEGNQDGRIYVSTYPTMVGKIDEYRSDGTRRFGVGYFDLVVIDEAHRSVFRKYRGIFEYFDSLLVGLTATPKDEVDRNTYDLFDLQTGVPTDAYPLDDAIADKFLVPPRAVSVPLKFVREGVKYDELSEDEKDQWDEFDWGEDEEGNPLDPPEQVDAAALNKFLFNKDTVDKVLEHLMTHGIHVAGGDRLGKSIIFAKNQRHADFIYERFVTNYPHLEHGNFARVITHSVKYAQSLIDDFSNPDKAPHIAISVDMLDTGIDVPEVVNLVFFKPVWSKTKFWQMIGRGTRLRRNLFGPGADKSEFKVFDFCQNLEYFSQDLQHAGPTGGTPLSEQIFKSRLELIQTFDTIAQGVDERAEIAGNVRHERAEVAGTLRESIASMNPTNFLVRPHLELVERFREDAAWEDASVGDLAALADRVAKLPDQLDPENEEAKRFDVLLLNIELSLLRGDPFERERRKVMQIADALEDQQTIPVVAHQLALIEEVQKDEWWQNVTYPMLEEVRKKLRILVTLIERSKKSILYSNFVDDIGEDIDIVLPGTGGAIGSYGFLQFRKKAEHFLRENLGEAVVSKVRSGEPLTASDIGDLQRMLVAAGIGDDDTFAEASAKAGSFGLFIRSLVGLDRAAAKAAFAEFLDDKRYSRNQIEFVNLIIDELSSTGVIEARRVYESPYDGLAPEGPEAIFVEADLERLFATIDQIMSNVKVAL